MLRTPVASTGQVLATTFTPTTPPTLYPTVPGYELTWRIEEKPALITAINFPLTQLEACSPGMIESMVTGMETALGVSRGAVTIVTIGGEVLETKGGAHTSSDTGGGSVLRALITEKRWGVQPPPPPPRRLRRVLQLQSSIGTGVAEAEAAVVEVVFEIESKESTAAGIAAMKDGLALVGIMASGDGVSRMSAVWGGPRAEKRVADSRTHSLSRARLWLRGL
jgi:hypothetical protein